MVALVANNSNVRGLGAKALVAGNSSVNLELAAVAFQTLTLPDDWALMRQGIHDWVRTCLTPTTLVIWGHQNKPAPKVLPHVVLVPLVPPIPDGQAEARTLAGVAVVVENVVDNATYKFTVGTSTISFTSGTSATSDQIQNGLAADLLSKEPTLVQEQIGSTAIRIEIGTLAFVVNDAKLGCKIAVSNEADATATFSIDVIGGPPEETTPPIETFQVLSEILLNIQTPTATELLGFAGWSLISIEGVRKPDIVAGASWEDRSGLDVLLRCRITSIKFLDFIETAAINQGIVGELSQ